MGQFGMVILWVARPESAKGVVCRLPRSRPSKTPGVPPKLTHSQLFRWQLTLVDARGSTLSEAFPQGLTADSPFLFPLRTIPL